MLAIGHLGRGFNKPVIVTAGDVKKDQKKVVKQLMNNAFHSPGLKDGRSLRKQPPYLLVVDCESTQYGVYVVVADQEKANAKLCFLLMDKVREWKCDTKPLLKQALDYSIKEPGKLDTLIAIEQEMKDVEKIMHQNIQATIDRQDRLETVTEASESLLAESVIIFTNSKEVRKKKCWQAYKYCLILICVIICVILVLGGGGALIWFLGLVGKLFPSFSSPTQDPLQNTTQTSHL